MGTTADDLADDLFATMAECASCGALNASGARVRAECAERIPRGERTRTATTTQRRARLGATRELQDLRRNLHRVRALNCGSRSSRSVRCSPSR